MSAGEQPYAPGELPAFLGDPRGILRRRWRVMLAVLLLGTLGSGAVWWLIEPRYYAEAMVLVSRQQVSANLVVPTLEEDALTRLEALAAEVLSRRNLAKLVEEFGLYPELRDEFTLGEIIDRMRQQVTIRAVQATGRQRGDASARAYTIGFEARSAKAAAGVANGLATLFVDTSLADRHRQHELTTGFLRGELVETEDELREQNRQIAEFKKSHLGLLPSDVQANLARLQLLQSQRQSLALQIAEAGTQAATLAATAASPESRLDALRKQLALLRSSHTERHPDVISAVREIEELERVVAADQNDADRAPPPGTAESANRTVAVLQQQITATEEELEALANRLELMPTVQEELGALEEKAAIQRERYLDLLRKVKDSELAADLVMAQQGERISLLNPAEPPAQPIRARWQFAAVGLLASLLSALALGFVLEIVDPVVVSAVQLERETHLPVLGWVASIR